MLEKLLPDSYIPVIEEAEGSRSRTEMRIVCYSLEFHTDVFGRKEISPYFFFQRKKILLCENHS